MTEEQKQKKSFDKGQLLFNFCKRVYLDLAPVIS